MQKTYHFVKQIVFTSLTVPVTSRSERGTTLHPLSQKTKSNVIKKKKSGNRNKISQFLVLQLERDVDEEKSQKNPKIAILGI